MWANVQGTLDRKGTVLGRRVVREMTPQESRRLERDLARDLLPAFKEWERQAVNGG